MNLGEAIRAIRGLRNDLRRISDKDQEQEVGTIALPVIDAVLGNAARQLAEDDPVIDVVGGLVTPEAIAAGEPVRALDAYLVADQLLAALERAQTRNYETEAQDWVAEATWADDARYGPGVILRVTATRGGAFAWFRCYVRLPDDRLVDTIPKRGPFPTQTSTVALHFPGDFRHLDTRLDDGGYEAHWYGQTGMKPDSGRFFLSTVPFEIVHRHLS